MGIPIGLLTIIEIWKPLKTYYLRRKVGIHRFRVYDITSQFPRGPCNVFRLFEIFSSSFWPLENLSNGFSGVPTFRFSSTSGIINIGNDFIPFHLWSIFQLINLPSKPVEWSLILNICFKPYRLCHGETSVDLLSILCTCAVNWWLPIYIWIIAAASSANG